MNISSLSLASVYGQLTSFAKLENFWSLFETAFGSNYDFATAASLRSQWQESNFSLFPQIEVVSSDVLGSANGAYAISTNKIYLSDQFVSRASQQSLDAVILEEFGHFVDAQVNATDTPGDEGELFSALVREVSLSAAELSRIQAEDDHGVIVVDGQSIVIEQNQVPNNAPINLSLSTSTIDENQAIGTTIGTFTTTDPDTGDTFTYSLVTVTGDNSSLFTIIGNQLKTNVLFDREVLREGGYGRYPYYSIRVKTTDQGGLSFEKLLTIEITNINEAPTDLKLSNNTIAKKQPVGSEIGAFTTTDPDIGNTDPFNYTPYTYSLVAGPGDTDNARFTIKDRVLFTNDHTFDDETQNSYSIRVKTTDQSGLSYEEALTINASSLNEIQANPFYYTYSYLGKQSIRIDYAENVFVKVVFQTSQPLAANTLYESQESANFHIGLIGLVDSSGQIVRDFNLPLLEFSVHTSNQGTIDAWDFSGDDGLTQNNHSIFTDSTQNFLFPGFGGNYPGHDQATITNWSTPNTSTWGGHILYTSAPLTSWTTSPSAPSDLFLSTHAINENQAIDTTVGTFTTRDLDTGNTFTYSLVTGTGDTDNALFTITDNQLKTNATFDYETRNRYSIRVKTTDQSGLSYQKEFTILVVNDVDEQNQLYTYSYLGNQSLSTTENVFVKVVFKSFQPLAANTIYHSIFVARDNIPSSYTYFPYGSLSLVNSFGQIFRGINSISGLWVHTSNQGTIDAWYAMGEGGTVDEYREAFGLVGFNVSTYFDPNSVLSLNHASYLPIGSDFADVENWSPDGSINTWDGSYKNWNGYTSYTSAPSWTISPPQSPPNNAPIDLFLSTSTINENEASGTTIGTFTTADPDTGNTFTYSLVTGTGDTDNTVFRIVGNQLKSNDIFDFETQNSYSIRVQTTDEGGLTFEKVLTIGITDINETPINQTPINLSISNNTVAENQAIGTDIGTFTTTDPDTGNTFTYSLVTGTGATDNALFTITGNQLKSNGTFDFETQNSYSIRVRTTDQGGLTFEKALTLNVKDIAGILSINNISVTEGNTGSTNATFTVSLSDPYAGTVSVDYATVNGTAYSTPYDYTAKSGTLNFSGGVTSQTVNVEVLADTYNESNETFSLNLSNPTNAQLANTTGTATIINDDPLPTFSISSLQLAEGDSGSKNAQLNVQLSSASGQIVTVNYTTVNGTANSGSDYTTTSGTLFFAPGNTLMSVLVPILGDTNVEGDETFTVTLSSSSTGATLSSQSTGTVTILNDDSLSGSIDLTLTGTTGNDALKGGLGSDTITGLEGNDSLDGSDGNDALTGGLGADVLTGGLGSDRFIYSNFNDSLFTTTTNNSYDRIRDFNAAQGDRIGLSNVPTSAYNAGTITATSLNNAIIAAFNDADPNTTGNQSLSANQAVFFAYGATSLKNTYLVVNDSSATFSATNDLFINITGLVGSVPTGSLTVNNYFSTL